jgi:hypothetical protein
MLEGIVDEFGGDQPQWHRGFHVEENRCGIDLKSDASCFNVMPSGELGAYFLQVGREVDAADLAGPVERLVDGTHCVQTFPDLVEILARLLAPAAGHEPKQGLHRLEVVLDPVMGFGEQQVPVGDRLLQANLGQLLFPEPILGEARQTPDQHQAERRQCAGPPQLDRQ